MRPFPRGPRTEILVALLAGIAASLALYRPILPTYFLSDDFVLIGRIVRTGPLGALGALGPWGPTDGGFLRPLVGLTLLLDHSLWGLRPFGYHLTNVALHGINGGLLYLLGRRTFELFGERRAILVSGLGAALFLSLGNHSEPVSWISSRGDLLAAAFGLGSTLCLVQVLRNGSRRALALALCLLSLSFLSKETALMWPGVWCALAAAHAVAHRRALDRRLATLLVGAIVCLAAYLLLRKVVLGEFLGGYQNLGHLNLGRPAVGANLARFLVRSLLPPIPGLTPWTTSLSAFWALAATTGGLVAGLLTLRRRHFAPGRGLGLILLSGCLLLSLVPVLTMRVNLFDTQGERFLYQPSLFAALAVSVALFALAPSTRVAVGLAVLTIGLHAASLRAVQTRWVEAAHISREVSLQVSAEDPEKTLILNLPDSYLGAYVFRNGLDEAATTFVGLPRRRSYRVVCRHFVDTPTESYAVGEAAGSWTLAARSRLRISRLEEHGLAVTRRRGGLTIEAPTRGTSNIENVLFFPGAGAEPMLHAVRPGASRPASSGSSGSSGP